MAPFAACICGASAGTLILMETVESWLAALGLEKYAGLFRDQDVGLDQLPKLADADLKELGLPLGPRKRILEAAKGAASAKPAASAPAAERRQLTIMFVDLVGSTASTRKTCATSCAPITRSAPP
jgi:hypothetical protein